MFGLNATMRFYLFSQPVDMRKSFDGLCGVVSEHFSNGSDDGRVYVFINKRRDKMRLLRWEPEGYVLYYKRLEQPSFGCKQTGVEKGVADVSYAGLAMLIEGLNAEGTKQKKRYK
jgi:transposase